MDVMERRIQVSFNACQKCFIWCMPNPPYFFGVKIICFEYLLLRPLMNLVIICSVLIMNSFGGFGITVATCVNLDMTQVLMMLTFAVMDGFSELHWYASWRALSRVLSQFI